jgi:hypothetical protein
VWNPEITRYFAEDYFLKFVPIPVRRISYAASFGLAPSEWLTKFGGGHYSSLLKEFHAISVREASGVELVRNLIPGGKVQVVLDPTLLMNAETYKEKFGLRYKKNGIISFKFYNSLKYYSLLEKMESFIGEKVVLLNRRKMKRFSTIMAPSPKLWLETIAGASFIVTDSFHTTCFAILFNKPFIVLPANPKRMVRLSCLLESLGISDRLYYSEYDFLSKLPSLGSINYDRVNERMDRLRNISYKFLIDSLSQ